MGYFKVGRWRNGGKVFVILAMLLLAGMQVMWAWILITSPQHTGILSTVPWSVFVQQAQLAYFLGMGISQLRFGAGWGATEYFENGVGLPGGKLLPWERMTIQPSESQPGLMKVVIRSRTDSPFGTTMMLPMPDDVRQYLLARQKQAASEPTAA